MTDSPKSTTEPPDYLSKVTLLRRIASEQDLGRALAEKAVLDPSARIRIATLVDGQDISVHVAQIGVSEYIQPHVHRFGDETYFFVDGCGSMHLGSVEFANNDVSKVNWRSPVNTNPSDTILVRPGWAHCLENTGESPLILVFSCPPSHLIDRTVGGDRELVTFPPTLKPDARSDGSQA